MVLLFLNSVLLLVGWALFIFHLKNKDNFGLVCSMIVVLSSSFGLGGISREYRITNKLVDEEVVERVYDSQTGEVRYIIKDGVLGFTRDLEPMFKED